MDTQTKTILERIVAESELALRPMRAEEGSQLSFALLALQLLFFLATDPI